MNRLYYLLVICACFVGMISCAKEDDLIPSGIVDNYFAVPDNATDEVSILRKNFYEKNGVYLLFNDTLRHEQQGTYEDGTPIWFTETIDFNYNISTTGTGAYQFVYLNNQHNCEIAASMVEKHILPHLGKGWLPYSLLLLDTIKSRDWRGNWSVTDCISSIRCMAIGVGDVIEKTDEEQSTFCRGMLSMLVVERVEELDESLFEEFDSFCTKYYGKDYEDFGLDWMSPTDEELYGLGMIYKPLFTFPDNAMDRKYFAQYAVELTEEEFQEKYGAYPIVMQKYEIIKEIISDLGYKF